MDFIQSISGKAGEFALQYGLRIVGVVILFLVGRWVARAIGRGVKRILTKRKVDEMLVQFASNMARYAVLLFVGLACLELFGIQTMSLIAVLGAAGLAVGLALQGTLAHFASGVMLLLYRPFKLGEVIETADVIGAVEKLGLFSTTLLTPDNKTITVPNGKIWGSTLKNLSDRPTRRVDVEVGVQLRGGRRSRPGGPGEGAAHRAGRAARSHPGGLPQGLRPSSVESSCAATAARATTGRCASR